MNAIFRALRYSKRVKNVYTKRFAKYGRSPSGVYWSNVERQQSRFKIILDQILYVKPRGRISIADVGCGYGALLEFIWENSAYNRMLYTGYDINPALIAACRSHPKFPADAFNIGDCPNVRTDFSLMSGTYNMAVTDDAADWEKYFLDCLAKCWKYSSEGMVFNLLCGEEAHISDGRLYYCNVEKIRRYCRYECW